MKLKVFHRTLFSYAKPVTDSFNEARLQPLDNAAQQRHSFILKVLPPTRLKHYLDFHLNCVHLFELSSPHAELSVEATSIVTTNNTPALTAGAASCQLADLASPAVLNQCYDFLQGSPYVDIGPGTWRMAVDIVENETDVWQIAQRVMRHVNREFRYEPNSTHVHTTMLEVLQLRSGVCQDFAHVMLGLCRALKIPARYVSGYLYNGPAERLKGAQASHAWVEVYLNPLGWVGLDPTNNRIVDGHYVKIGVGRSYNDVPPVRGTYRGTQERKMAVDVLVSLSDAGATMPTASATA
ncbi:MAG: transglutaminase family protein [Opitutaceae bacterium]|nr:transglutaminase family protein [Opitutaceae bacterium]